MPTTPSGLVLRRAYKGCMKLCKGYHGRVSEKQKPFGRCFSTCLSVAQKGGKRGYTRIPKRGAKPIAGTCPSAAKACMVKAFKSRLVVPKTKDRYHGESGAKKRSAKRRKRSK